MYRRDAARPPVASAADLDTKVRLVDGDIQVNYPVVVDRGYLMSSCGLAARALKKAP